MRELKKITQAKTILTGDPGAVPDEDFDILWLEWANDLTAAITKVLPEHRPFLTVVRVHDHEIRHRRINHIDWSKVDVIWFINRQAMYDFREALPAVYNTTSTMFLPNAVDPQDIRYGAENSHDIALLSISCRPRKRIDRALKLLQLLPRPWRLHIRTTLDINGPMQYYELLQYAEQLFGPRTDRIVWHTAGFNLDNILDKSDVSNFFSGKRVVLSTSEHEGFHYAVAEGALAGCEPVVYNWEWGYARDFWGDYVYDSLDEMAQAILDSRPGPDHRAYVEKYYSGDVLAPRLISTIFSAIQPHTITPYHA